MRLAIEFCRLDSPQVARSLRVDELAAASSSLRDRLIDSWDESIKISD